MLATGGVCNWAKVSGSLAKSHTWALSRPSGIGRWASRGSTADREEVAGGMQVEPQGKQNVRVAGKGRVPERVAEEVARLNESLAGRGRILVRPSGTEPLVRVLVEAEAEAEATKLFGTVVDLVRQELGTD